MKNYVYTTFLIVLLSCCSFSQRYEASFNSFLDSIIFLDSRQTDFEININLDSNQTLDVFHVRDRKLISSKQSTSGKDVYKYSVAPMTDDLIIIQIASRESDGILYYKNFKLINNYLDSINLEKKEVNKICESKLTTPIKYSFKVYLNDHQINDYEVKWFESVVFEERIHAESSIFVGYHKNFSDPIVCNRLDNVFYLDQKYDSLGLIIRIGENGYFLYHITEMDFKYGADLYFSVSTNDQKLYEKYEVIIENNLFDEKEKPFLAIVKNYTKQVNTWNSHSNLMIDCNLHCNPTHINKGLENNFYTKRDLK